jgi:hypothetical protein
MMNCKVHDRKWHWFLKALNFCFFNLFCDAVTIMRLCSVKIEYNSSYVD